MIKRINLKDIKTANHILELQIASYKIEISKDIYITEFEKIL